MARPKLTEQLTTALAALLLMLSAPPALAQDDDFDSDAPDAEAAEDAADDSELVVEPAGDGEFNSNLYKFGLKFPAGWNEFDEELMLYANEKVQHLTGLGYVAGASKKISASTALVFPYMLVQFRPYSNIDHLQNVRPTSSLMTDHQKLMLLLWMTFAFDIEGNLPPNTTIDQFKANYSTDRSRLVAFNGDRFDITGVIPYQDKSGFIQYHTHGVLGKDGIANVTVFATQDFDRLAPIIDGTMRTLAFDHEASLAALPATPPAQTAPAPANSAQPGTNAAAPGAPATASGTNQPNNAGVPATQAVQNDSSVLWIIIGALGFVLVVIVAIVAMVTHQNAKAKRQRVAARRARISPADPHQRASTPRRSHSRSTL